MSRVISIRLRSAQSRTLERLARVFRRSAGETAALLLDEKLREETFPFIEFRSVPGGRMAFVKGSRVAVWQVVLLARDTETAIDVARHLGWDEQRVQAALAYAKAYPEEQDLADEAEDTGADELRQRLPWLREVEV